MNNKLEALRQKRDLILRDMQAIDQLRRGTLSKQFFKTKTGRQGPYFVLQGYFHGEKFSHRVAPQDAPQVQQQVDNYQRFQKLAEQYVSVSDELTRLRSEPAAEKKTPDRRAG